MPVSVAVQSSILCTLVAGLHKGSLVRSQMGVPHTLLLVGVLWKYHSTFPRHAGIIIIIGYVLWDHCGVFGCFSHGFWSLVCSLQFPPSPCLSMGVGRIPPYVHSSSHPAPSLWVWSLYMATAVQGRALMLCPWHMVLRELSPSKSSQGYGVCVGGWWILFFAVDTRKSIV